MVTNGVSNAEVITIAVQKGCEHHKAIPRVSLSRRAMNSVKLMFSIAEGSNSVVNEPLKCKKSIGFLIGKQLGSSQKVSCQNTWTGPSTTNKRPSGQRPFQCSGSQLQGTQAGQLEPQSQPSKLTHCGREIRCELVQKWSNDPAAAWLMPVL